MTGLGRETGRSLNGYDHLAQSVATILGTRLGTRIKRRDFGSRIPELMDKPLNAALKAQMTLAVWDAIDKWEPRISLSRVQFESPETGRLTVTLTATLSETGRSLSLEVSL